MTISLRTASGKNETKMEEIEAFVRKLCAEGDLSVLSKKLIRTQYQASYNKESLSREEKDKINEVLEAVIQELADQTKDTAVHTNVGANVNTSSVDQGKENLHSDVTCAPSNPPPPLLKEEKVVWAELGSSFLGHNHLRRFQLLMNHGGRKSGNVRTPRSIHSSAGGVDLIETNGHTSYPQPLAKTTLFRRTSKDSVPEHGESNLSQDAENCGDRNSGSHKVEVDCSEPSSSSGIKQSTSSHVCVESGPSGSNVMSESSEDVVQLLSPDSASDVCVANNGTEGAVSKQSVASQLRCNRSDIDKERCTPSANKAVPSGLLLRQKQRMANKRVSLQTVLSAVLQSEESENSSPVADCVSVSSCEDKSSFPIDQPSSVSSHSPSRPLRVSRASSKTTHSPEVSQRSTVSLSSSRVSQQSALLQASPKVSRFSTRAPQGSSVCDDESKVTNIYTQLKVKINLVKPATESNKRSAASKSESNCQWSIDRKLESGHQSQCISAIDDSSEMSRADESEEFSSPLTRPTKDLLPTVQARQTSRHSESQKRLGCSRKLFYSGKESEPDTQDDDAVVETGKEKSSVSRDNFKDVSHSGFSSTSFFRKKSRQTESVREKTDYDSFCMLSGKKDSLPVGKIKATYRKHTKLKRENYLETAAKQVRKTSEKHKEKRKNVSVGHGQIKEFRSVSDELDLDDLPLNLLRHVDTKRSKPVSSISDRDSDDMQISEAAHQPKIEKKLKLNQSSKNRQPISSGSSMRKTGITIRLSPVSLSPPLSPVVMKSVKQFQKSKQAVMDVNVSKKPPAGTKKPLERSVYSLSESTGDEENFNQIFRKKFKLQKTACGLKKKPSATLVAQEWSVYSVSENTSSDTGSFDGKFTASRKPDDRQEGLKLESDEPWKITVYRGECLMFPVIKLTDIKYIKTLPAVDRHKAEITPGPKRERNVFEFIQSATSAEEVGGEYSDSVKAEDGPSETPAEFSESPSRREKIICSVEHDDDDVGLPLAATLEASRSELKKQRTVKRMTPKLCLNLKLRKQPSPNKSKSSSEVEEWTVVTEEEDADWQSGSQPFDGVCTKEKLKQTGLSGKKSKSKKRRAPSSDEEDLPLKMMKSMPVADRSDNDLSEASDKDCEEEDTPVKVKKSAKKKKLTVVSSDEDDQPLKKSKSTPCASQSVGDASHASVKVCEEDTPVKLKVKVPKKSRSMVQCVSSSDEDDLPLKPRPPLSKAGEAEEENGEVNGHVLESDRGTDNDGGDDSSPLKSKKSKSKKRGAPSSDEEDLPLKMMKSMPLADRSDNDTSEASDKDCREEDTPVKVKKVKRKKEILHFEVSDEDDLPSSHSSYYENEEPLKVKTALVKITPLQKKVPKKSRSMVQRVSSSDEDDLPLKPRLPLSKAGEAEEENGEVNGHVSQSDRGIDNDGDDDSSPLKLKPAAKRNRTLVDEDDVPIKPKPVHDKAGKEQADSISESDRDDSGDDATPLKAKKSTKAVVVTSSDENSSPFKLQVKKPDDHLEESCLDTSSLSSDGEIEVPLKCAGSKSKPSQGKPKTTELGKKESKTNIDKSCKKGKESSSENEEAPYLKRLRLICRKVGIFVRNNVHFVGCTTDNEKIERLKEALRKAGMKGQPSLSKVDSVNLKREAEALDTTNIIETAGRPKRKPKDVFSRTDSPKKSLTPIKQQFSRIRDLVSDSESD